jgi:hypothetical protein
MSILLRDQITHSTSVLATGLRLRGLPHRISGINETIAAEFQ